MSRVVLAAVAIFALSIACAACGAARTRTLSGSLTASARARLDAAPRGPLEGDEDDDDAGREELGHESKDPDVDGDNDRMKRRGYYDHDDGKIRAYGHRPSAEDERALTALVKRYYAAASADDGAAACSMLTPTFAKSIPLDYGRGSAGPAFLRSATTCPGVLTLLLEHAHAQASAPITVKRIRVKGARGLVLIGAPGVPAGYLEAQHEGGAWRLVGTLASPLP